MLWFLLLNFFFFSINCTSEMDIPTVASSTVATVLVPDSNQEFGFSSFFFFLTYQLVRASLAS